MKRVTILGEGAWGTAVATLLAHNGYHVSLWCHYKDLVDTINTHHTNERFLPGIMLDKKIQATASLQEALKDVTWVFEAIPVKFLRNVLEQAKPWITPQQTWVVLSKGIEQDTLLFPSYIIDEVYEKKVATMVFAGPSFAMDVARKQITAVTIAALDCERGRVLQKMLANDYFRPYITTDMIGVQVGAALKNVITIGIGMLDGAGYTDNAKAFLLTRGLYEMTKLGRVLGGKQETFYGLSGVGDLVLTGMGTLSRNLLLGRRLSKGEKLDTMSKELGVTEGINTVQSVYQLLHKKNISLPICRGIYEIMFMNRSLQDFLHDVMAEPLIWECE